MGAPKSVGAILGWGRAGRWVGLLQPAPSQEGAAQAQAVQRPLHTPVQLLGGSDVRLIGLHCRVAGWGRG